MATIPLATKFNPAKLEFPCLVSVKYDGVPICIEVNVDEYGTVGSYEVRSRSGKPVPSVDYLVKEFMHANTPFFEGFAGKHYVVGELLQRYNPFADFKETSGIARKKDDQSSKLQLAIFDYYWTGGDHSYYDRIRYFKSKYLVTSGAFAVMLQEAPNPEYLESITNRWSDHLKDQHEGFIVRSYNDLFIPGKRSNGYQKLVKEPMIDLWVVGVTEAVDKYGSPKAMVGGLVVQYKQGLTKIGAGKLTHKERTDLFGDVSRNEATTVRTGLPGSPNEVWYELPQPLMAQIKHKDDDSYDNLRQPTFQVWRPEKTTPDA